MIFFTIAMTLLLNTTSASAADCTRSYGATNEIRLVDSSWQIGTFDASHTWKPLSCDPKLETNYLGAVDGHTLEVKGEGHQGRTAAFVFYPGADVPDGTKFTVNPMDLFGANRLQIDLVDRGWVFLDKTKYQQLHFDLSGMNLEFDAEPGNPEIQIAKDTLTRLSNLFPVRKKQIMRQGEARVILATNASENFQERPLWPNGFHYAGGPYYAVLFSQDGNGTQLHSFHELGGLFRIFGSDYAHGLTWMVAFDQIEKLAPTPQEKLARQCADLKMAISLIDDTAKQKDGTTDYTHPMEYYMDDPIATGGWDIYAWTSGIYWKKINRALETQGKASVYALINNIHENGIRSLPGTPLNQLLAAYARMSPDSHELFDQLALRYFRQNTLGDLKRDAEAEKARLDCPTR